VDEEEEEEEDGRGAWIANSHQKWSQFKVCLDIRLHKQFAVTFNICSKVMS